MRIASSLSVLLVTEDQDIFSHCQKELWERFDIEVLRFNESDLKISLREVRPFLIIWDSRSDSPRWKHFASWLRDHFPGRPIFVLLEGDNESLQNALHRQGIHVHLDVKSPSFYKSLQVHVFAVLLDFEKEKIEMVNTGVS
jgi:hypothetical protein